MTTFKEDCPFHGEGGSMVVEAHEIYESDRDRRAEPRVMGDDTRPMPETAEFCRLLYAMGLRYYRATLALKRLSPPEVPRKGDLVIEVTGEPLYEPAKIGWLADRQVEENLDTQVEQDWWYVDRLDGGGRVRWGDATFVTILPENMT